MNNKSSFWEMDELRLVVGAMIMLAFATGLLVVLPRMLVDDMPAPEGLKPYTDLQKIGRQSYIANGCVYCHSQQPRDIKQAPDATRGWGRASVAGDYVYDAPHLMGTMRTGPDLFNIGARQPSKDWNLGHLYQPRAYTPGSIMPAFPFLFEERSPSKVKLTETVVTLPPAWSKPDVVIVAKPEALALVEYLGALDHTYPALPPHPKPEPSAAVGVKP